MVIKATFWVRYFLRVLRTSTFWKELVCLFYKSLLPFLTFVNCKGPPKDFFTTFDHVLILCLILIAATHSFKFTVNRNFSKEILTIILILPWFQACIYWKMLVVWRHHLQPSIFSMIVSLFQSSTWSNPHVKETVFISKYFLQPSVIINGLRLIRENVEEYVYLRKPILALLF